MDPLEQIIKKIDELNARSQEIVAAAEAGDKTPEEAKSLIDNEIKPQLDVLIKDREDAIREEEMKALKSHVTTLETAIDELRKPSDGFVLTNPLGKSVSDDPYNNGEYSTYADLFKAVKFNDPDARERMSKSGVSLTPEGKAMTEGTNSQGGYLVQPLLERQIVLAREKDNVLRGLCATLNVNTTSIQLDQLGLSTKAGWVAELATKPEETAMTLATITASIFTAAGLATISNQLLEDSNPSVDQLVTTDIAKRIVALEEEAFLNGSGSGQPLGLLNTSGIATTTYTDAENKDPAASGGILDNILTAIANVQENWGQPSAILMHPRTWTAILKSRDSAGHYTIAPRNNVGAGYDPVTPRTYIDGPQQTLFGVEVVLSNRIPTNLGAGTNQSRIIVGDFREALILDRMGITVDSSPHVYFTTNATVFRAESRVGFTAARSPLAFNVIGGTGLANR